MISLPPPPIPSKTPIRDAYPVSGAEISMVDRSLPPTPTPFLHSTTPYDYSATPTHPTFIFDAPSDNSPHHPSPLYAQRQRDTPSPGSSLGFRTKSLSWTLNKLAQGSISSLSTMRRSLTPSVLLDYASRPITPRDRGRERERDQERERGDTQNGSDDSKTSPSPHPRSPSKVYFPSNSGIDNNPPSPPKHKLAEPSVDLSAYEIELDSFDIERDLAPGYHEKELSPLPTPKTFDSFILPPNVRPSVDSDGKSEKTVKQGQERSSESVREELPPRWSGS